jgi:hypothetical protein
LRSNVQRRIRAKRTDDASLWRERVHALELEVERLRADRECGAIGSNAQPTIGFATRKEVFEAWKQAFGKKRGVYKSGDKRDRVVQARLKTWSIEQLKDCVRGYSMDPWRHGGLVRHELATLLRNDGQIEAGLEIKDDGGERARAQRNAESTGKRANKTVDYTERDRVAESGVSSFGGDTVRQ